MEDGATPFFNAAETRANILARSTTTGVSRIFKERISKAFDEGSERARPNTEATINWKMWYGYGEGAKPLVASGTLKKAIKNPEISTGAVWGTSGTTGMSGGQSVVTVTWDLPSAGQNVYMEGMVRKNPNFTYLWAHEFGGKSSSWKFGMRSWGKFNVPKRAFLVKGLTAAMRESLNYTTAQCKFFYDWAKSQEGPKFALPQLGMERETRWGGRDLVMLAAPPSVAYAGIGGGLDFLNILKGQFSLGNYEQWLVQMGKGKAGATRLSQRRQIRKRLWS